MTNWQNYVLRMTEPIGSINQSYCWELDSYSLFMAMKELEDDDVE